MNVKVHQSDGKIILAICDEELLGKKFIENNKQLDLTSDFYKGKDRKEDEIRELVKKAYIVNIVGKKSVDFGIKEGIISKEHIIKVDNIPHAQAVFIRE